MSGTLIRLAVIGTGGHGGAVLEELQGDPAAEVVALAPGTEREDPAELQQAFPVAAHAGLFADHREMLRAMRPNVVIINTRLDRIAPLAIEAMESGCHVICEKPIAADLAGLGRLWETARAHKRQCVAILGNRAHPVLLAARQCVDRGEIGRPILFNARKSYRWGTRPAWFGRRETYPGTIPWIGIHALDFIAAITDSPFTSVAALQANVAHPDFPDCQDACAMMLSLAGGEQATVSLDYLRPAAADSHGDDWLRIVGTSGVIEAHLARNRCTILPADEPAREVALPNSPGYFAPLLRRLSTAGAEPSAEMLRSFHLTCACLCGRDAAERGQIVPIPQKPFQFAPVP